jgi:hypothetical protein
VREPILRLDRGGVVLSDTRLKVCTRSGVDVDTSDVIIFPVATDSITAWYLGEAHKDEDERLAAFQARLEARRKGRPAKSASIHPPGPIPFTNQHVIGFIEPDHRLDCQEQLRLEFQLGTVIHRVTGPAGPRADVQVLLAEAPSIHVPAGATALESKRLAVWHAGGRNKVIAEVATALASSDSETLWRHGLSIENIELGFDKGAQPARIAILVESPEHGRELAKRLPGWSLRQGRPENKRESLPPRSIVTLVHAHGLARLDVDFLIRADGSDGCLNLGGFPGFSVERQGRPVILIDFGDDDDPDASRATRRRLRDYQGRGWTIAAPDRWMREPESDTDGRAKKSGLRAARSQKSR